MNGQLIHYTKDEAQHIVDMSKIPVGVCVVCRGPAVGRLCKDHLSRPSLSLSFTGEPSGTFYLPMECGCVLQVNHANSGGYNGVRTETTRYASCPAHIPSEALHALRRP